MPPNAHRDPSLESAVSDRSVGANLPTSRPDATPDTFPEEAESLLRHLNLGAARAAAPPTPADLPRIPHFEIEQELGRGGMGVVYKARQVTLNRTVALKMILASAHAAPSEVTRFLAEAEAIAAVKHPNVVEVYDLGDSEGRPYFVMEFVGGGNLAKLLKTHGPLAPTDAAALIADVACGVQAAHEKDIVHRDLKPANILLAGKPEKEGDKSAVSDLGFGISAFRPKVSDFGLAKRLASDLTRSQAVMGTPAYMAPEQAGGKAKFVGPAADVYALGVILYECLTGRPPFDSPDAWSLIRQVLEDSPESLRKRVPGVPRDLELICLKCLEKEPHDRYPTAAALAADLHQFLKGEPVSVRPISPCIRLGRCIKRHPALAGLVGLVASLAIVVPPVAVWQQGRLDRRDAVADEARQKEEAAKLAEEQAKRAQAEAEKARLAADKLAEGRELFALQTKFRNRAADRFLGWTRATRDELPRAVRLADDAEDIGELRSVAAVAMLAEDLLPLDPAAVGMSASALATDPKSGLVAVGEHKSWFPCRVLLIDPNTGQTVRTLTFPTTPIKGKGPLDAVQDGTRALAFGADGKWLFVGTRSSQIARFDLDSPQNTPALMWNASSQAVDEIAVSPNGKAVYGVCRPESCVLAWDAETGKPLPSFAPPEVATVRGFALSPSGELVACNGRKLYRWSADGNLLRSGPNDAAQRLAATGSSLLLVGNGSYLDAADRETLTPTDRFVDPTLRRGAHEDSLRAIVVHPSGAFAATQAGDSDRTVKVWALGPGRLIGTVRASGTGPIGVAWSADGTSLLVTSRNQVDRWRFVQPEAQQFLCLSAFPIETATFLPDGRVAALAEFSNNQRELLLQGAGGPLELMTVVDRGGNGRPGITSEPGGTLAVTRSAAGLVRWKPGTPFPLPENVKQCFWYPRFGRDGQTLWAVVNAREVRTYDAATKVQRGVWNNSFAEVITGLATLESLAAGRGLAVAGGRDGTVYVLNSVAELVTALKGAGDPILAVAVAPDDSLIAAGTQKGLVRLMQPATKTELPPLTAHAGGTTAVAVNRDGTLLATGGRDRAVRLWKRSGETFEPLLTVSNLSCSVRELQFSADDNRLLILLDNAHAARIWDINRLQTQLAELRLGW